MNADGEVGTGWTYSPCDVSAMLGSIDLALGTFRDHKDSWKALMRNGMSKDLSWDAAAEQYEQIFEWAMMDPAHRFDWCQSWPKLGIFMSIQSCEMPPNFRSPARRFWGLHLLRHYVIHDVLCNLALQNVLKDVIPYTIYRVSAESFGLTITGLSPAVVIGNGSERPTIMKRYSNGLAHNGLQIEKQADLGLDSKNLSIEKHYI